MVLDLSLNEVVRQTDDLVTLPGVFLRINRMVDDPDCSIQAIGEVIAQDPGLTVRLLRMANSVFYGLSQEIDTVSRAVTVIGTRRVRDLILATSVVQAFDGIPNDLTRLEDFWQHSIFCGLIARHLADSVRLREPDSLFVAGLLHDIGRLVMYSRYPDASRRALEPDAQEAMPMYLRERRAFGFDHAELGGALARHWQLPTLLIDCIAHHHQPERADNHAQQAAIVHLANGLSSPAEESRREESLAQRIDPAAWRQARLEETQAEAALSSAREQFSEMSRLLLGTANDAYPGGS